MISERIDTMPSKFIRSYRLYWNESESGVKLRVRSRTFPYDSWDEAYLNEVDLEVDEDCMPVASILTEDIDPEHKEVFLSKLSEAVLEDLDNMSEALSTRKKLLNDACADLSKIALEE